MSKLIKLKNKQLHKFIKIKQIEEDLANGKFDRIDFFLKNTTLDGINYALEWASSYGKLDLIKKIIILIGEINFKSEIILKPACENCHIDIVKYALEHKADISSSNYAALTSAVRNSHYEIVHLLLKTAGHNSEEYNKALIIAIGNGSYGIAKLLIEYGSDVNSFEGVPLLSAIGLGNLEMVKILVNEQTTKTIIDSAIDYASYLNKNEIVNFLKEKT